MRAQGLEPWTYGLKVRRDGSETLENKGPQSDYPQKYPQLSAADSDLILVNERWLELPGPIKDRIIELVKTDYERLGSSDDHASQ